MEKVPVIDQQLELEATTNVIVPASASILGPREPQDRARKSTRNDAAIANREF